MKRTSLRTVLCVVLLAAAVRVWAASVSTLTDVRSATNNGQTRVTLAFSGDIRFSTEQVPGGIRLAFSQTRSGIALNTVRRLFPSGQVRGMTVTPMSGDSLTVTLALVQGSSYRCVLPASGSLLYIDLQGGKPVAPVVAQSATPSIPLPSKKSAAMRSPRDDAPRTRAEATPRGEAVGASSVADTPRQGSSLIDIPAVARRQVEGQEVVGRTAEGSRRATQSVAGMSTGGRLLLSALLSVLLTAALLFIFRSRLLGNARPVPARAVASPPGPAARNPVPARLLIPDDAEERLRPESSRLPEPLPAVDSDEEDYGRETSLQLARTFRRGSEEITLARKFHEHTTPVLTPAKMETAIAKATTRTQRLQAARKLGVGRGEFDLAAKLRSLQQGQGQVKKEEQQ